MGRVFKPFWTKKGDPARHYTKVWYAEWTDHTGRQRRQKGFADKAATLQLLAKLEREAAQVRAGLTPPAAPDAGRPLADLLAEYLELMRARQLSAGHVRNVRDWLPPLFEGCRWRRLLDVDADRLVLWMGEKRATCSPATVNAHLSAVKAFARWACKRCGLPASPLADVTKMNEQVDRRRSRRILTPDELAALLAAAARAPRRYGMLVRGADRAMLYRVAAYTGLRASELASLTPASFDLAAAAVTVEAKDSKGKRAESVPLPAHLAAELRPWLARFPAGRRVWPGDWAKNRGQADWLGRDVRRAGIAEHDANGHTVTFHSLRAFYITWLIRSGADVKEVQTLARHRSIQTTLSSYARVNPEAMQSVVDRLPAPGLSNPWLAAPPGVSRRVPSRGRSSTGPKPAAAFRKRKKP